MKNQTIFDPSEYPEPTCKGCYLPEAVWAGIENQIISALEAMLLGFIDRLVEFGGEDCFASNSYFAKALGVSERTISTMINHLIETGMLQRSKFDGRKRYLKTFFSRPEEHISRQTRRILLGRQDESFESDLYSTESIENLSPSHGNDSESDISQKPKKGWKSNPIWMELAQSLKDAIATVRKTSKTSDTWKWAEAISKIHSVDNISIEEIRHVMKWYCEQIQKGDLIKDNSSYTPIAYSGKAFRDKFDRIEAAMYRAKPKSNKPRQRVRRNILPPTDGPVLPEGDTLEDYTGV